MELSVESMGVGVFTGPPVKREVIWNVGEEEYKADVYVRKLSYRTAVTDLHAISGQGDLAANRIAQCIVNAQGDPIFSVADITGINDDGSYVLDADGNIRGEMHRDLSIALLSVIGEVNELGKTKATSLD